jgi:hypothetical protein
MRSWLGLLNPSTAIVDTNILGSIVIEIRLAPANCLVFLEVLEPASNTVCIGTSF